MPTPEETQRADDRRLRELTLIAEATDLQGYAPSVTELMAVVDVSHRTVRKDLEALERAGHLKRFPRIERGLKVTDEGRSVIAHAKGLTSPPAPRRAARRRSDPPTRPDLTVVAGGRE